MMLPALNSGNEGQPKIKAQVTLDGQYGYLFERDGHQGFERLLQL